MEESNQRVTGNQQHFVTVNDQSLSVCPGLIASHFLGNETALHLGADKFGPDTNRAAEIESGVQHNQKLNSYDLPMKLVQLGNQQKRHFVRSTEVSYSNPSVADIVKICGKLFERLMSQTLFYTTDSCLTA